MPELKFKSLDAIPEELRTEAKQDGAEFVINVVSNKKLAEFRDNNIAANRERDELKARLGAYQPLVGDDPVKFKAELDELRTTAQLVKDGKLSTKEAVSAEIENRVKAQKETFEGQLREVGTKLGAITGERDTWKSKFERSVLHQQITNAVIGKDSVANPEALPDILSRAEGLFVVQPDGTIVPKKGDTVIYGSDGANPMSPKEWLTKLVAEAPYLGKLSSGGGANGNRANEQYGLSPADFAKLSPQERITRHRQAQK